MRAFRRALAPRPAIAAMLLMVASTIHGGESTDTEATEPDAAPENAEATEASSEPDAAPATPATRAPLAIPEIFTPSEDISEDIAVPFPVDM